MTHLARRERLALCDTFETVGPDQPTLCGDWTTADLAAHLVVRESRLDAAPGIVIKALAPRIEAVQATYAARPWPELVDLVRSGPPVWSPTRLPTVDDVVNLVEFYVHHEDVLRAGDHPRRDLDARLEKALWAALRRSARLMFRKAPTGVVLVTDHARAAVKAPTSLGTAVLRGRPGELLLFAYGRQQVADVEVEGPAEAVEAITTSPLGMS